MSRDFKAFEHGVVSNLEVLRKAAPDTMSAFASLATAATATNTLGTIKPKESMALAIGIAVHFDGCVAYPTNMAYQYGAMRQGVIETIEPAINFGGGPSAVYGGNALTAHDQFANSQLTGA